MGRSSRAISAALLCAIAVLWPASGQDGRAASPPAELVSTLDGGAPLPRDDFWPSISGDGQVVVLTNFPPPIPGIAPPPFNPQVFVRDRASGTTVTVPANPLVTATTAGVVSRDGCHVAYWAEIDIGEFGSWTAVTWNRCQQGSQPEAVSSSPPILSCTCAFGRIAISADGRYVAYPFAVDGINTTRIVRVDTVADTELTMPGPYTPPATSDDMNVDIADDGGFVAVQGRVGQGVRAVYGWAPGSNPVVLSGPPNGESPTAFEAFDPSVSADGRYVTYTYDDGPSRRIVVEDRSNGQTRSVSDRAGAPTQNGGAAAEANESDISPDGSQIAYSIDFAPPTPAVYVVRTTGGFFDSVQYELVSYGVDDGRTGGGDPSMSTTGRFVAFMSDSGPALSGQNGFPQGLDIWLRERPPSLSGGGTLDFGALTVGSPSGAQNAVFTNTSNVIIPISGVTPPGAPFSITSDGCSGAVLQPGASCLIGVAFTPGAPGNAGSSVGVSGEGVAATVDLRGAGLTLGALTLTPANHNFGAGNIGTSFAAVGFTVTNTGGTSVGVATVGISGAGADQFTIDSNACAGATLAPGATCAIGVSSRVTRSGQQNGSLGVGGSNGQTLGAALQVTGSTTLQPSAGALSLTPVSADFGAAMVGTALPAQVFTARNSGGQSLTVSSVAIGGAGATQFAIGTNGCADRVLAPNATCQIQVTSTPTLVQVSDATLTVIGNGGQSDSSTLRVEGTLQLFNPTLVMNPAVARPGQVTTAVGAGFPPGTAVQLAFGGESPFATVTADAVGGFRFGLLLLPNGVRLGPYEILALDQPQFSGVRAPLLVDQASFEPSGSNDAGFINGLRSLYGRGG